MHDTTKHKKSNFSYCCSLFSFPLPCLLLNFILTILLTDHRLVSFPLPLSSPLVARGTAGVSCSFCSHREASSLPEWLCYLLQPGLLRKFLPCSAPVPPAKSQPDSKEVVGWWIRTVGEGKEQIREGQEKKSVKLRIYFKEHFMQHSHCGRAPQRTNWFIHCCQWRNNGAVVMKRGVSWFFLDYARFIQPL